LLPFLPNDPEMEKLRDSYARETDPAKARAFAAAVQSRALETAQYGWLGQWYGPGAARSSVTGWLKAPVTVPWNVSKA
jgi:peptide/nickel transport system substrate-binding protein